MHIKNTVAPLKLQSGPYLQYCCIANRFCRICNWVFDVLLHYITIPLCKRR